MIYKISKKIFIDSKGFALVELLFSISILSLIIGLVGAFQADVFSLNRIIQYGLQNQTEAKNIIRPFANEVRSAAPSNLGAYPIAHTHADSFMFYTDIDGDGLRERIRYFLQDGDFKKGIIKPTGQPLEYDVANEKIIQVVHNVVNTSIFEYYDSSYDGTASSSSLIFPVAPIEVRLVKVTLDIDSDPNKPPEPFNVTTQVSIRNIKDNL